MRVDAFPDVEAVVSYWLRTTIPARVYSSIPREPVYPLITVKRIGGISPVRQRLDRANVQLETWGNSKSEARDLADAARVALYQLEPKVCTTGAGFPVNATVTGLEETLGLAWLPDPLTDRDRYIQSFYVYAHA